MTAFLDRVLDPPSYGWAHPDGSVVVPTRAQLVREALSRMNVFRSRKNWLAFSNWAWTLSLAPLTALGLALLLGVLVLAAATRHGNGTWSAPGVGATHLVHVGWTFESRFQQEPSWATDAALHVHAAAVVVHALCIGVLLKIRLESVGERASFKLPASPSGKALAT